MSTSQIALVVVVALLIVLAVVVVLLARRVELLRRSFSSLSSDVADRLSRMRDDMPGESLTKADALLIVHEEIERLYPASQLATASRRTISEVTEVNGADGVIYFSRPTAERMFDDNLHTLEPIEDTLYRLTPLRDEKTRAVVDFCPSDRAFVLSLEDRYKLLAPVCDFGEGVPTAMNFRQSAAGVAILKNGFWTVVRKVQLEIK